MFIPSRINLQFGPARCSAPTPITIPSDPIAALCFAARVDRQADHELAEGRFASAERLSHLALEARARATGARA